MTDSVTRSRSIAAPPKRVWQALTDAAEFGTWFHATFDAPFVAGTDVPGRIFGPGGEVHEVSIRIVEVTPHRRFAFDWDSDEPGRRTRVTFDLAAEGEGTRVTVVESGFDAMSDPDVARGNRDRNARGWEIQLDRIAAHVDG